MTVPNEAGEPRASSPQMENRFSGEGASQDAPNSHSSARRAIATFFQNTTARFATEIFAAFVTVAVGWASPLGDVVKNWLWPERIEITGEIPAQEKELRDFSFVLQTKTQTGFSGGTIKVSSTDGSIEFIGDTRFVVGASTGSVTVPESGQIKIRPLTSGTHIVHVELETNRSKKFEGDIEVAAAARDYGSYVGTEKDWIGTWSISVNGNEGEMELLRDDDSRHLSGTVKLHTGETFKIDPRSWHDGTSFLIRLVGTQETIKIEGLPCTVSKSAGKWRILNGKVSISKDGKSVSRPVNLRTIRQRCDNLFYALRDTPGDGVFEAWITLK